jgi:hypothetical protein
VAGEAIALVSVASGATVAVAVPYINARLERSKLRAQSHAARLDELRATLDEAVIALSSAQSASEVAERSVEAAQHSRATASRRAVATQEIDALRAATDRVERDAQLLGVRLGAASDPVRAYESARRALRDIEHELDDILAAGPASDEPTVYAEATRALAQLRERHDECKSRFLNAAALIVGPDAAGL